MLFIYFSTFLQPGMSKEELVKKDQFCTLLQTIEEISNCAGMRLSILLENWKPNPAYHSGSP